LLRTAGLGVAGLFGARLAGDRMRRQGTALASVRGKATSMAKGSGATSLRVLWRARTEEKVMALTFDDGPGRELTAPLLDALREEKVRATFCLVGRQAFEERDLVRRQMRDGHDLVNHTWTHANLALLDYDDLKVEMERTDQLLYELTGRNPGMIRPPYGHVSGALLQHAAMAGQGLLLWDVQLRETRLDTAGNVDHVIDHLRPGCIVLGHDHGREDRVIGTRAIPEIIRRAKAEGYRFVTASEMFEIDAAARPQE
jgi:peptidoglycan/xylan/chitin deacetylase (PgdA/CDA1 family)